MLAVDRLELLAASRKLPAVHVGKALIVENVRRFDRVDITVADRVSSFDWQAAASPRERQ
jgi:hypothetical protein